METWVPTEKEEQEAREVPKKCCEIGKQASRDMEVDAIEHKTCWSRAAEAFWTDGCQVFVGQE